MQQRSSHSTALNFSYRYLFYFSILIAVILLDYSSFARPDLFNLIFNKWTVCISRCSSHSILRLRTAILRPILFIISEFHSSYTEQFEHNALITLILDQCTQCSFDNTVTPTLMLITKHMDSVFCVTELHLLYYYILFSKSVYSLIRDSRLVVNNSLLLYNIFHS